MEFELVFSERVVCVLRFSTFVLHTSKIDFDPLHSTRGVGGGPSRQTALVISLPVQFLHVDSSRTSQAWFNCVRCGPRWILGTS